MKAKYIYIGLGVLAVVGTIYYFKNKVKSPVTTGKPPLVSKSKVAVSQEEETKSGIIYGCNGGGTSSNAKDCKKGVDWVDDHKTLHTGHGKI